MNVRNHVSRERGRLERRSEEHNTSAGRGTHNSPRSVPLLGVVLEETAVRTRDTPALHHNKYTDDRIKLHFGTTDTSDRSLVVGTLPVAVLNKH